MIKQFEPHDVAGVMKWVRRANAKYLRLLAFMPVGKDHILCAYSCAAADTEMEAEIEHEGGKVIGYYGRTASPMQVLGDISITWEEVA